MSSKNLSTENKSLNVKTKGKASTLEDLSASPSCTSSGKPTKANDKEMTSTNIVNGTNL